MDSQDSERPDSVEPVLPPTRVAHGRHFWWFLLLLPVLVGIGWWRQRPLTLERLMPSGVAVDERGTLFFSDKAHRCIWMLTRGGRPTRFAGREWPDMTEPVAPSRGLSHPSDLVKQPEGIPAREAYFMSLSGIAAGEGCLYIVEDYPSRVRKIDSRGRIFTVWQQPLPSGKVSLTRLKTLLRILGVAPDRQGGVFLSTYQNARVVHITRDGRFSTVAGTGKPGYSGDGGPATRAQLNDQGGIASDREGNLYIADMFNQCVRKVDHRGILTTVARTGSRPQPGPGGRPTLEMYAGPERVAVDRAGNLYIASIGRVLKLDREGRLTTLFDNNFGNRSPQQKRVGRGQLGLPVGIAAAPDGSLYLADLSFRSIRRLDPSGRMTTVVAGKWPRVTVIE